MFPLWTLPTSHCSTRLVPHPSHPHRFLRHSLPASLVSQFTHCASTPARHPLLSRLPASLLPLCRFLILQAALWHLPSRHLLACIASPSAPRPLTTRLPATERSRHSPDHLCLRWHGVGGDRGWGGGGGVRVKVSEGGGFGSGFGSGFGCGFGGLFCTPAARNIMRNETSKCVNVS